MKFRFWLSYTNRNGKTYGAGLGAGYAVHTRGWHAGAKVTPREYLDREGKDVDVFEITMTSGSANGGGIDVPIGKIYATKDGPRWEPRPNVPREALYGKWDMPS